MSPPWSEVARTAQAAFDVIVGITAVSGFGGESPGDAIRRPIAKFFAQRTRFE